ncbi:MAG TPA: hypothetical protein DEP60_05140, partial [Ruminococcaceae bacterium]|nr:hypothetical protein [Oscillospiraceae bacterium]
MFQSLFSDACCYAQIFFPCFLYRFYEFLYHKAENCYKNSLPSKDDKKASERTRRVVLFTQRSYSIRKMI